MMRSAAASRMPFDLERGGCRRHSAALAGMSVACSCRAAAGATAALRVAAPRARRLRRSAPCARASARAPRPGSRSSTARAGPAPSRPCSGASRSGAPRARQECHAPHPFFIPLVLATLGGGDAAADALAELVIEVEEAVAALPDVVSVIADAVRSVLSFVVWANEQSDSLLWPSTISCPNTVCSAVYTKAISPAVKQH